MILAFVIDDDNKASFQHISMRSLLSVCTKLSSRSSHGPVTDTRDAQSCNAPAQTSGIGWGPAP